MLLSLVGLFFLFQNMSNLSAYETIANAKNKSGKYVHIVVNLDKEKEIEYDPIKNPNHLVFYVKDSTSNNLKVVYSNVKPTDMERTEKLVLKGRYNGEIFQCEEILLKCPSKYKDDKNNVSKSLNNSAKG